MNWETINWEAISAVGTILSAIATFAAVFVALFQTKIENLKRLKLSFSDNHAVMGCVSGTQKSGPYIHVSAANIGNRDITIQNWYIQAGKNSTYLVLKDNADLPFLTQLPAKIRPEESIGLAILRKDFLDILREDKRIGVFDMCKKIEIVLLDNTGKAYKIKSRRTVRKYLKMGDDD